MVNPWHGLTKTYLNILNHYQGFSRCQGQPTIFMKNVRKFYDEYKPYIFSDGWYYVFIVVFIILLFVFFS